MKKIVILVPMLFLIGPTFSQAPIQDKKIIFGFNLGLNQSYLTAKDELPASTKIENGIGFRMGILMDCKINENLFFAPKVEISFNDSRVLFFRPDNRVDEYGIFPMSTEIMAHVVYKKAEGSFKPYFLVGPALRFSVPEKKEGADNYINKPDLAIDFGVGLERVFPKMLFAPEIRYSIGLLNVNKHPSLKSLNFNSLSLMFNFKG